MDRFILFLRHSPSRQLACLVCQCEGKDHRDRRLLSDVTRRVGSTLRKMRGAKAVEWQRGPDGAALWQVVGRA